MANERISDLVAGTPPFSGASLVELSVPAGGGTFNSRKAQLSDIATTALVTIATKTTNYTVTTGDVGTHFNNSGASAEVDFSLPPATAGLIYTFVVIAAQILKVIANGAETIKGGTTFSATNISSSSPFSTLTIECHIAGTWISSGTVGIWA